MKSAIVCFHAAFEYEIRNAGRGIQKKLSSMTNVQPSVINDIYKRRTHGSEATRERLVNALGYSYEDFLSLGRSILEGKDPEKTSIKEPESQLSPRDKALIEILSRLGRIETMLAAIGQGGLQPGPEGPQLVPPYPKQKIQAYELLATVQSAQSQEEKLAAIDRWNEQQRSAKRRVTRCKKFQNA